MVGFEILITFLVFVTLVLFSLGIFFYADYQKERWKISKRIKQMTGIIKSEEFTDVFYKIKDKLVKFAGSLGKLVKPRSEGESSSVRKLLLRAGYRRGCSRTLRYSPMIRSRTWRRRGSMRRWWMGR